MAKKQTKRQRKFQATGGVQKRLEKGTISKRKGSKNNRPKTEVSSRNTTDDTDPATTTNFPTTDDFMGPDNLGQLDVDSFFAQFTAATTHSAHGPTQNDEEEEEDHMMEDDDDDDEEDNEEEDNDDEDNTGDDSKKKSKTKVRNDDDENDDDEEEEDDDTENDEDDELENNEDDDEDEEDENSDLDDDEDIERMEAQMKRQMKKMESTDPEFHSFLKENEESLLEYNDTDDDDDADDDEMGEGEGDEDMDEAETASKSTTAPQKQGDARGAGSNIVTDELLQSILQNTFQKHSMKSLKKLMNIYKSACFLNVNIDTSASKKKSSSANDDHNKPLPYSIEPSSQIYDEIMMICFQKLHLEFRYHLLGSSRAQDDDDDDDDDTNGAATKKEEDDEAAEWNKTLHPKVLERSERWNEMKQVLLSFYRSTLHLLVEVKELEFLAMICQNAKYYLRFMTPFPRISELFLKTFTNLWSAPIDTIENYQIVRLNSFFRIRQLALLQPFPFIEECLKKTYLAYLKRAKFGNISIHSPALPTLTFMGNCLVELYNMDYHSSYQHAFVYIRQLALLLRGVMQKKTIESMQQVYCWQYLQCLKLWVAVLSSAAQQESDDHGKVDMKSLIYPLIEIIVGTTRLIPSPVRHLPYRCHCVRLLQQLAASTELFIPTTSILLDCFDWKEFTLVPRKTKESSRATTRGVQLSMMIKFGKEDPLRTHDQLEASMNELFLLLNREIDLYRYSPGFPEYAIRITVRLRQLNKEIRNPRWKTYIKACIDLCDTCTLYAVQGRSKLQQAPREVQQLECLKPIPEKSMYERYNDSVRKEQVTLDAINGVPSMAKNSNKRRTDAKDGDDDKDNDDEENDTSSKSKKKKRKKKKAGATKSMDDLKEHLMDDEKVMEATDQVQEGIDWSDDDNE